MPVRVICRRCGFIFYEGKEPISPDIIAKRYAYRCPRCLSRLRLSPLKVKIELRRNRRTRARRF
ncbi:MAG: hypothetical protein J7L11_03145 [Thermoprotei archaeon]|nr:hypothetical protein [Thermoprotei archaeon]